MKRALLSSLLICLSSELGPVKFSQTACRLIGRRLSSKWAVLINFSEYLHVRRLELSETI